MTNRIWTLGLSLCSLALATAGLTACGGGTDTSSVHPTTPVTTSAKANPYTAGDMSGVHDQNFLRTVKASHIPYDTEQSILDAGHVTCFSFDQGESFQYGDGADGQILQRHQIPGERFDRSFHRELLPQVSALIAELMGAQEVKVGASQDRSG